MSPHHVRLHKFDSGVLVVQSVSHSKEAIIEETSKLVNIVWLAVQMDRCSDYQGVTVEPV